MATSNNEVTLGYWGFRARGGLIRSILGYCEIPFIDKRYNDFNEWFGKDKQSLGVEYPNLPYIIDGDKKITESFSLLYYVPIKAGKRELIGDTDDKFIQVRIALDVAHDLFMEIIRLV